MDEDIPLDSIGLRDDLDLELFLIDVHVASSPTSISLQAGRIPSMQAPWAMGRFPCFPGRLEREGEMHVQAIGDEQLGRRQQQCQDTGQKGEACEKRPGGPLPQAIEQ